MTHKCTPFCEIMCAEKTRAKLQQDAPRSGIQLANAPIETKAVRGGPLVERAIFQAQLPEIYRDPVPPHPEMMRYPWIFASSREVSPGEEFPIGGFRPQIPFIGEALRVEKNALDFWMTAIRTANMNNTIGETNDFFPCSLFDTWKRYDLGAIGPADMIHFIVQNRGKTAARFAAILFGRIEYES